MSLFDSILRSRDLTIAPTYLWMLKLRSDEYETLKTTLQAGADRGSFSGLEREVALFYAEWWRREFNGGYATAEEVSKYISVDDSIADVFYQAALQGIKRLGLPVVITSGQQRQRTNFKYSLLYHGGLPMNYIENEVKKQRGGSKWDRFFRALCWNEEDYTEISEDIGEIASLSPAIRVFCKTLQQAGDISEAPFSPNKLWWDVVQKNFEIEKKARKARDPFLFKWIIEMRDSRKEIDLRYHISGPRYLSPEFIEKHTLDGRNYVSIGVLIEGEELPLAEYNRTNDKFYSRRNIEQKGKCKEGESISIVLDEIGEPLTHRFLEFSDPKLVCLAEERDNSFAPCDVKQLSEADCRIIASDDWVCEDVVSERYFIGGTPVKVFFIAKGTYPITLHSEETSQQKTFDPQKPLLWTVMDESRCLNIGIATKERLFNAPGGVLFYEGKGDKVGSESVSVLYADRQSKNWGQTPHFGPIKASVKKAETESVEAVNFINVGNLSVKIVSSTKDTCTLSIDWKHGAISFDVADFINDKWVINKNQLLDRRTARFVLTPCRGLGEEFSITLIPPFYGFGIYDFKGRQLENEAIIPLADLDSFRYYMRMRDRLSITPGDRGDELKYRYTEDEVRKCVTVKEELLGSITRVATIPYEGRLASLFMDGSNTIYELLEKTTDSLPDAKATIRIKTNKYYFQDYPYHLKYENNSIVVLNYRTLPGYDGDLYALPFSNPESEPIKLNKTGDNVYTLPSIIDNTPSDYSWLVYGDTKGYILPLSVCPYREMSDDERALNRETIAERLKCELKQSKLFSEDWHRALAWFRIIQDGRIPASSVLELVSIADDRDLLELFAFHLYLLSVSSEETDEDIRASMLEFQQQMSFLWKWAGETSLSRERLNELYADSPEVFNAYYKKWVKTTKQDDIDAMLDYLLDTSHIPECLEQAIKDFHVWLGRIKEEGIPEQRLLHPDINNNGGDEVLSDEAQEIFRQVRMMSPKIARLAGGDEGWIAERYHLSEMFSVMNFGDFGSNERVKTELKKTIIYGLKFKYNDEI